MCGIVALVGTSAPLPATLPSAAGARALGVALDDALGRIAHRGPDAAKHVVSANGRAAFGHCRLAINDLTPCGEQPLVSPCGQVLAIVNGEIYDHLELRDALAPGYPYRGTSDSEVVLALYMAHGLACLEHLRGEFAVCIYDGRTDTFIGVRDRYGIKPLFYREDASGVVMLAAEMKAFLELGWAPEWDVGALADGGWGQDTRTVFKGVRKVRPGHYLIAHGGAIESRPYWDLAYPHRDAVDTRSFHSMVAGVREHLVNAVRVRLRADVPVGIYLSGGIDSACIAGIAAHLVKEGARMGSDPADKVCCFSIGFDESSGFDESDIAERTADFLGVRFIRAFMSEESLANRFAEAVYHVEHHTHDLNFVGKYALSEVPRQEGYKVVLTGEGADEHFGGYPLYQPDFMRMPDPSGGPTLGGAERAALVDEHEAVAATSYDLIGGTSAYFAAPRALPLSVPAAMAGFTPPASMFKARLLAAAPDPVQTIALNVSGEATRRMRDDWHPLHAAMYTWTKGHLANQFLSCLGDRVEMAHSVEARTPFLDHKLTEYVNGLPPSAKIRHTRGLNGDVLLEKYVLREAVKPFVTPEIYARKKHPYSAPTAYPPGGPVHRMLVATVSREAVEQLGFVEWDAVYRMLQVAFAETGTVDSDAQRGHRTRAFRNLLIVASWVVLGQRFGVKRAG